MKKVMREEFKFNGTLWIPTGTPDVIEVTDYNGDKMVQNNSDRSELIKVHTGKVIHINSLLDMNNNLLAQNIMEVK